ncbi:CaiB/BaiF CoA transferase family protein [Sheuella amnicola]|nr:CoA transferase [Sheuella amnicola]
MLPLHGVRVLDLTRALSGPFCAMILADLGAEVIKVEAMPEGDMSRDWGPFDGDISVYYLSANRNKKSIAVDFRKPQGLELIKQMAIKSDIVVENFRVGTLEKMGLDYDSLKKSNPGLIVASISGFGSKGPASQWAGFDQIAQGYSGYMSLSGTTESGPMRVGTAIGDMLAGMWLSIGVLSALMQKRETGHGQQVETSLLAGLIGVLSVQGQRYLNLGEVPKPLGNSHPVIAPYGTFKTSDGPLNLAPATQGMWLNLCNLLGLEHLIDDPRYKTNGDRMKNRDSLQIEIEAVLTQHPRMHWTPLMIEKGIPAGPINKMDDVFKDDQVEALKLIESVKHPVLGVLKQIGMPVAMESIPEGGSVRFAPPLYGQHTREILKAYGVSQDEIEHLIQTNIIHQATVT